ncbi:hypothetical protein MKK69_19700 [Methylobacterium sp. J-026]|uniref:hypothetical protein n=1 Tax=Methylobacterium sp. J-026 TaxID=2836624 RepID=UPI001FB8BCCE|nr:hypothetical protein [Methylobacterium sp. J-026]MCJ2136247.1 hypothetical protein [Methylobacterium sp. J-026]
MFTRSPSTWITVRRGRARHDKGFRWLPGWTRPGVVPALCALLLVTAVPAGANAAADPADPRALERAWHRCLRDSAAHQPAGQSRAGNERNALDECKPSEDALVAALMSGRPAEDGRPGTVWSRTWAAFVEPLTAWIGALRR